MKATLLITDQARSLIAQSVLEARRLGNSVVSSSHIVIALSRLPPSFASGIIAECGVDTERLADAVEASIPHLIQSVSAHHASIALIVDHAFHLARSHGQDYCDTECVLLAALRDPDPVLCAAFQEIGSSVEEVATFAATVLVERARGQSAALRSIRDTLANRPEDVWRELELIVYSDCDRPEMCHRLLRSLTHRLAAHGSVIWKTVGEVSVCAAAGYGAIRPYLIEEATYVALAGCKDYLSVRSDCLILTQRVELQDPLLLQVIQRRITNEATIRGYRLYLQRVAQLWERSDPQWKRE